MSASGYPQCYTPIQTVPHRVENAVKVAHGRLYQTEVALLLVLVNYPLAARPFKYGIAYPFRTDPPKNC